VVKTTPSSGLHNKDSEFLPTYKTLTKKKWFVNYPNISSVVRLVPHIKELHFPVPPQQYNLDSDDEAIENREKTFQPSTSTDADFTADLQFNEIRPITQEELIYLIRDLYLT
jgi:hypothetical protein